MTDYNYSDTYAGKDALPTGSPGKLIKATELNTEFNNIETAVNSKFDKAGGTFTGNIIGLSATFSGTSTLATVDINGGAIDGTVIGGSTAAAGSFTTVNASGNITGNLVGDVTGDVTGNLTGDVTGNLTGDVTGNVTGDVTGDLTGTIVTAAQPNITSVGTLTGFTSTGIDDNASAIALTLSSSGSLLVGATSGADKVVIGDNDGPSLSLKDNASPSLCNVKINAVNSLGAGGNYSPFMSAGQGQISATSGGLFLADGSVVSSGYPSAGYLLSAGHEFYRRTSTSNQDIFKVSTDVGGTRTTVWRVDSDGTAGAPSDARMKKNIVDAGSGNVDDLRVVAFDWKNREESDEKTHVRHGFIAQELYQHCPEAVLKGDDEKMWGVDNSKLVPLLVKEIQELRARVTQLEAK